MNITLVPVITEKTTMLANEGWYTFRTGKKTNKKEAKDLIEKNFKVKVMKIRSVSGKSKIRRRGRQTGSTKEYKKILVSLKKGQKIDIFEVAT